MPIDARYVFIVSMDVQPDKEALFNEVYDTEHVPLLSKVPGVRGVSRFKTETAKLNVGGKPSVADGAGAPRYVAIYEIDSPEVMLSDAWQKADCSISPSPASNSPSKLTSMKQLAVTSDQCRPKGIW